MMKNVALWSPKGGVGKTTLALNLAAAAVHRGHKVIVCDFDPQQSAVDVFKENKLSFTVISGKPQIQPRADLMISDMPPRHDVSIESEIVIVPMRASILDIRAVKKSIKLVHSKRIIKCINAVDVRRQEERLLAMRLFSEGAKLIKDRSVYSRAIMQGKTVFDVEVYGASDARAEILRLYDAIYEEPAEPVKPKSLLDK